MNPGEEAIGNFKLSLSALNFKSFLKRYVASMVASGIKKNYPKASIKLTPGGCGTFFEIYEGKDADKKLIHSKKKGDGEPEYDQA